MDMDGLWHLVFHYYQKSDSQPQLLPAEYVRDHQWFQLNELPPESDLAYRGLAKYTIDKIKRSIYR